MSTTSFALDRSRRRPLASAVAVLFALSAPTAYATTFVTNCNDTGAGSLRAGISTAAEGDTVDASALTVSSPGCGATAGNPSVITLKTGAINVTRNNLTVKGPGKEFLKVTAKYTDSMNNNHYYGRVFNHTGTGSLSLQDMSITKGYTSTTTGTAFGGCVYSKGSVALQGVYMLGCRATATSSGKARGGGVYSKGATTLFASDLKYNRTSVGTGSYSQGGGVWSAGNFIAKYSTIENNSSSNVAGNGGFAGGVDAYQAAGTLHLVRNSTISGNRAAGSFAGIYLGHTDASVTMINSTVSGNTATTGNSGGAYFVGDDIELDNNTIAYNTAKTATIALSPGMSIRASTSTATKTLVLQSNLMANNSYGTSSTQNDFTVVGAPATTGANNLIRTPSGSVPADTIVGKCPLLKKLANNGGLTETHSLYGHSPALDAGNTNGSPGSYDQRGAATNNGTIDYPRVSGPPGSTAVADIGAFELDQSEHIFDSAFEGCP